MQKEVDLRHQDEALNNGGGGVVVVVVATSAVAVAGAVVGVVVGGVSKKRHGRLDDPERAKLNKNVEATRRSNSKSIDVFMSGRTKLLCFNEKLPRSDRSKTLNHAGQNLNRARLRRNNTE